METVGRRLRDYRLRQNISRAHLAERAGLGVATVARAEAGHNPRLITLIRILRALGRLDSLDALLPEPALSPLDAIDRNSPEPRRRASPKRADP